MEWEDADALGVWKKDELGVALPGLCGTTLRESCHFDESCWDHLLENPRYSQLTSIWETEILDSSQAPCVFIFIPGYMKSAEVPPEVFPIIRGRRKLARAAREIVNAVLSVPGPWALLVAPPPWRLDSDSPPP